MFRHTTSLYQEPPHLSFTAASQTQSIFLLGLPEKTLVVGVMVRLLKKFVAFGMSQCSVTIGTTSQENSNITSTNYYMPSFTCTQNVSETSFMYWSPMAMFTTDPQDIRANFTAVGAQMKDITAGEVEITMLYRSI